MDGSCFVNPCAAGDPVVAALQEDVVIVDALEAVLQQVVAHGGVVNDEEVGLCEASVLLLGCQLMAAESPEVVDYGYYLGTLTLSEGASHLIQVSLRLLLIRINQPQI